MVQGLKHRQAEDSNQDVKQQPTLLRKCVGEFGFAGIGGQDVRSKTGGRQEPCSRKNKGLSEALQDFNRVYSMTSDFIFLGVFVF